MTGITQAHSIYIYYSPALNNLLYLLEMCVLIWAIKSLDIF